MTAPVPKNSMERPQKKGALSNLYNMLAKSPRLRGKAPVAALDAEKLAERAAEAESELGDDRDEDYNDAAEEMPNDDAEYVEATTPPATSRSKPSPKQLQRKARLQKAVNTIGKGKQKRLDREQCKR
ncbi:Retrotransposable element [Phytophthora cinnamomi]|uniref:Retrotransposable element n=1 Tax=Phytophthora cinnamomi TaxID=4785 RepID=UPI00355A0FAF|nr:Retrotransposable element [Phytophthora cinnamomi]